MRRLRRVGSLLSCGAVGVVGAWLGMLLLGHSVVPMGPFRVQLRSSFGRGVTDIALPPFGRLVADTHLAPLRFTAILRDVRVSQLTDAVRRGGIERLVSDVERDALAAVRPFAFKLLGAALLGALILALLVFRTRWRAVAFSVAVALVAVGGSEGLAWRTYSPSELLNPTFSGSLALAPKLIGPAQTALDRIDDVRAELVRVLAGAARVYTSIQTFPTPGSGEIRVLHISDVHLSPLGTQFAQEVASAFEVDLVLDTGDLTSFGTPVENLILSGISMFHRPYVFVRGNHDSRDLTESMRRIPNAIVLEGQTRRVAGLTIYGRGDPVFTPNKQAAGDDEEIAARLRAEGQGILFDVTRSAAPPDVVAVHDDRMAEAAAGFVPLVVSGHFHTTSARTMDGTLFLRTGSTGGAGANVFTEAGGIPLTAEVLYFSGEAPHSLVAYDVIEQSPETGSLTVKRHLISEEYGQLVPTPPPPSLRPTPTDSGATTLVPSGSVSPS